MIKIFVILHRNLIFNYPLTQLIMDSKYIKKFLLFTLVFTIVTSGFNYLAFGEWHLVRYLIGGAISSAIVTWINYSDDNRKIEKK